MKPNKFLLALLGIAAVTAVPSCSFNSAGKGIKTYVSYDRPAELPRDPGAVEVRVSLSTQRVYVLEGETLLMVMPVSVGEPKTPTPVGNFTILGKEAKHRSEVDGLAVSGGKTTRTKLRNKPAGSRFTGMPLPYWCEFRPGYAFHTGWIKHSPCTNGSVRMHQNLAPKFFRIVSVGTPVNISYRQPEDEKHSHITLPPDAGPLPDYPAAMYLGNGYFDEHLSPEFD